MPYAPGILVHGGSLVFLSGVTAAAVYHSHPHRDDEFDLPATMREQAVLAMENLGKTLAAAGCTFADLVSATRFLTDVAEQDDLNRVWAKYLDGHLPTTTTVEVSRLATHARCKIEISAVAVRGEPRRAASRAKSTKALRGEPRRAASRAKDKKKVQPTNPSKRSTPRGTPAVRRRKA